MKKMIMGTALAASLLLAAVPAAFAGELTGSGKSLEPLHANSVCAYSGQNDDPLGLDPNNGPAGRVQSFGQVVKLFGPLGGIPGTECRGGSL